tara:strand:- start:2402 stop:2695 length:294 start_codon:yes stop_codon:yes gene_type:complete
LFLNQKKFQIKFNYSPYLERQTLQENIQSQGKTVSLTFVLNFQKKSFQGVYYKGIKCYEEMSSEEIQLIGNSLAAHPPLIIGALCIFMYIRRRFLAT